MLAGEFSMKKVFLIKFAANKFRFVMRNAKLIAPRWNYFPSFSAINIKKHVDKFSGCLVVGFNREET